MNDYPFTAQEETIYEKKNFADRDDHIWVDILHPKEVCCHLLRHRFEQWAKRRAVTLKSEQIRTEQVQKDNVNERFILDPSTGFRHESRLAMGQVTVWESRQMEYEVLNIESEELILWKYVEKSDHDNEVDFDELLQEYFQALKSGCKP